MLSDVCSLLAFSRLLYLVPCSLRCHSRPQTTCASRPLPSAARFAHNSGGGHRALGIDDATPGLARMIRAPQENRSLDTPSMVLRLCYRRCGLLDAVSLAPVGMRGCPATHWKADAIIVGRAPVLPVSVRTRAHRFHQQRLFARTAEGTLCLPHAFR